MFCKKWCLLMTALVIVALFSFTNVSADGLEKAGVKVPKLQSVLKELNDNYDRGALTATRQMIDSRGLIVKDNKVRVMLDLMPGMTPDEAVLQRYDVEVERKHDTFWRVLVPLGALRGLAAELEAVRFIRKPMKPHPETGSDTSEGVALTNADAWHTAGFTGSGVSVAVIDGGFHWTCDAEGSGDIPTNTKVTYGVPSFYDGGNCYAGDWHGTNVTDILIDMAPDVDLYLIRIGDESDLADAKDYCVTNGIDIINMSLGFYNAGDYAGNGPLCDIVDDADANGILFVKSAGNNQNYHYMDMFSDGDANGWHNFSGADEENLLYTYDGSSSNLSAGWGMDIYLFWDWPTTTADYDLYLYRMGSGTPVATSTTAQTGAQPGIESIEITLPVDDQYYIKINRYGGPGSEELKLYTVGYRPEYRHSASSYSLPADAAGCFVVGARHQSGWAAATSVDDYSSFGPTLDGRVKPDIVGPSCVDISISTQCFGGTSAAAPHVAGAAALVMEACPTMNHSTVKGILMTRAIDAGVGGPDNEWGWGKLDLGSPTDVCPEEEVCYPDLPPPELVVVCKEFYISAGGNECTRYRLEVPNWMTYPDELFEISPDLPPCGGNPNASRTWVDIFAEDGTRLYGFCAIDVAAELNNIWFGTPREDPPPANVYIEMWDRRCDITYTSSLASTDDVPFCDDECEQPILSVLAYQEVSWADPLWEVKVEIHNAGPGTAKNISVVMNSDAPWLLIPDPNCAYGDIAEGASSWGLDSYTLDLSAHPGGTFDVWFDVTYEDDCGNQYRVRLDECEQPILTLLGYQEVSWADPLWEVQVEIHNAGPGPAKNVVAVMNSDIPWLLIPDPTCAYGDIAEGTSSWGLDSYTFDLSAHPGGSFNVWFDVIYEDDCGQKYRLRLDPEFDKKKGDETPVLSYKLGQNYPNPFNPNTTISFQIPAAGYVSLNIYDASGKLVRTLVDGHQGEGFHAVNWNGKDNNGAAVASGIYFYKINAGSFIETKKMVLMR